MPAENESLTFEPNDTGGHETGALPSVLSETWPTLTDACLSLADASAACFFMTDLSGDIVDATPAWRRLNERFGGRSTCAIPGLVPLLHRTKVLHAVERARTAARHPGREAHPAETAEGGTLATKNSTHHRRTNTEIS